MFPLYVISLPFLYVAVTIINLLTTVYFTIQSIVTGLSYFSWFLDSFSFFAYLAIILFLFVSNLLLGTQVIKNFNLKQSVQQYNAFSLYFLFFSKKLITRGILRRVWFFATTYCII